MRARSNHLLRVLGIAFGVAAVVGSVVGQGILRSPGIVAEASGSPAILIGLWALGAALSLIAALPFAELAAAIPCAGGGIAYAERAFGPRARVVVAFTLVLLMVSSQAMLAFVTGEFLVRLGVGAGRIGPGALATGLLVLIFGVNAIGTRLTAGLQIGLSSLKGAVLVGLVIVLFAQPAAAPDPLAAPAMASGWFGFGAAMLVIIGAYNGWGDLTMYGEEIANPGKAIPRALFGGILGVAALYLAVNLALLHTLTPTQMARSSFAAADAARGVFGDRGDTIFTLFGVLSVGAITSLGLMSTSRAVFATARAGILPRWFARVTERGTPMRALALSTAGSMAFLWSDAYLALSATSNTLSQCMFVIVALAALTLRRNEPDMPRPFRMPFYPLSIWLVLAFDLVLLAVFIVQDPTYSLLGMVLVTALSGGYLLIARVRSIALEETIEWPSPR